MIQSGPGKGTLVPTGKQAPQLGVNYEMSQYHDESKSANGAQVSNKKTAVRFITNDKGQPIPLGDYDLVIGDKMVRLKHIAGEPEWLVLSSSV